MTKSKQTVNYWIGTSGWSYTEWLGRFYPKNYPRNRWLDYYAARFNSVEVNVSFYRSLPDRTYQNWYEQSPEGFRFVIKASRFITHRKYLLDIAEAVQRTEQSAYLLKAKLGVILLQLPPNMPYDVKRLEATLQAFQHPEKVAIEFRDNKWLTEEVRDLLMKYRTIFCNVNSPTQEIKDWLTSDSGYIRLHGHKKMFASNYSNEQLQEIAKHARKLVQQGAKEIYIFFNNTMLGRAFRNAKTLVTLLSDDK